jgi:hypothetical protein
VAGYGLYLVTLPYGTSVHVLGQSQLAIDLLRKDSRRDITQAAVRAMMIVLLTSLFDNRLCFLPIGKQPAIQTLSPKCVVEALDRRVFPRATRLNIERVAVLLTQPLL